MTEQDYEKVVTQITVCVNNPYLSADQAKTELYSIIRKAVEQERKRILEGLPERMRDDDLYDEGFNTCLEQVRKVVEG